MILYLAFCGFVLAECANSIRLFSILKNSLRAPVSTFWDLQIENCQYDVVGHWQNDYQLKKLWSPWTTSRTEFVHQEAYLLYFTHISLAWVVFFFPCKGNDERDCSQNKNKCLPSPHLGACYCDKTSLTYKILPPPRPSAPLILRHAHTRSIFV